MKIAAIILAAGRGTRAAGDVPKTYRLIGDHTVLRCALRPFINHVAINSIQTVIHADDRALYDHAVAGLDLPEPVIGGATRAHSVLAGMDAVKDVDAVLIHDGARPYVDPKVIGRVVAALDEFEGAIPVLPVVDALWSVREQSLAAPVPRENLVRAQTPQGFHYARYLKAIKNKPDGRDDAEVAMAEGMKIGWVDGAPENIKLTYPEDFA